MLVAIVNDNIVTSIVELSESEYSYEATKNQLLIDISTIFPTPKVGWTFDGINLVSNGNIDWKITKLAMRNRFTISELTAFYNLTLVSVPFKIMLDNLSVSTFIDLRRPETYAGVMALVSAGVLTSDRAYAILNTEPNETEVYRGV